MQLNLLINNLYSQYFEKDAFFDSVIDCKEYIYKKLDFLGNNNQEFMNPLNKSNNDYDFNDREIPLTGKEEIDGKYLLFSFTSHDESMFLIDMNTQEELKKEILGVSGYLNMFTTYLIPIIEGQVKQFEIYYTLKNNDTKVLLIKDDDKLNITDKEKENIEKLELKWL